VVEQGVKTMDGKNNSPFIDYMKKQGIPLTRETYLSLAMPDVSPDEIGAELESEIPEQFKVDDDGNSRSKIRIVRKEK
jgi:hypothetical protein